MHFLCFKGPDCAVLLTRVKAHRLQSDFSLRVDSPMRHFDINMDWQRNDDFWPNMNPKRNLYLISWWGRLDIFVFLWSVARSRELPRTRHTFLNASHWRPIISFAVSVTIYNRDSFSV